MSSIDPNHPYSLEILPCYRSPGRFQWAIRKHGKLLQRSDRSQPSQGAAEEKGQEALERAMLGLER